MSVMAMLRQPARVRRADSRSPCVCACLQNSSLSVNRAERGPPKQNNVPAPMVDLLGVPSD
jgi:hypothetical protein